MSRINLKTPSKAQEVVDGLCEEMERRLSACSPGVCPIDMAASFVRLAHAQTCGKCVPCRVGLSQLVGLMEDVLRGQATMETVDLIEKTARVIKNSADCAIGFTAADMALKSVIGYRDEYESHVLHHHCTGSFNEAVPCVAYCPAGVDIPGYIALVHAGRYADAVKLIRKDNPFPVSCGMVCEHPCESRCRRNMLDASINIRGLKRFACDNAGTVPVPARAALTGKKVAVIGGGPSGLSAAYYLALMGHDVKIFEQRKELGGMIRYGIPSYRLPRPLLDEDINAILSVGGIEVQTDVAVGKDVSLAQLKNDYDAVFVSIGAHTDKKLGIDGENGRGIMSAVEMLRAIGNGDKPDFTGKKVVIVGGGNVAMDCTRSSMRLGAEKVTCVYRRRQIDMTALPEEVQGAIAEGCEIATMMAPSRVELDKDDNVRGLWVQPQMTGQMDGSGRPRPVNANKPEELIECDIIIVAIGQNIESAPFEAEGLTAKRGQFLAKANGQMDGKIFAGGDCVTGPATVIRAIAGGKVAAANIDAFLGYAHEISVDVDIPAPAFKDCPGTGRVAMNEREAAERKNDFELMECGMSLEEAMQESGRCLRCDKFGYGKFREGRTEKW